MSQSRNTKKYIGIITVVLILGVIVWYSFSWIKKFQSSSVPVYSDSASLVVNSKQSLIKKVVALQTTINAQEASLSALSTLEKENMALKAELGREESIKGTLGRVVVPPNRSIYDTLVIDVGIEEGITVGASVYAFGSIALGTVSDVGEHSSTVLLYSASGRQTVGTTTGSDIAVTLIGRGSGEYEVRMPRDIVFEQGGVITEQSADVYTLATIQKIVTDARDPFQRLLAKAPVNLQAMKWVIVK